MAAGTLVELDTSGGAIDTSDQLNMFEAFQKVFVVNGANLKVADFVNTKITDDNGFTTKPARGDIVYQAGTDAATMVVDYINGTDKVMFGYTTSGTFEITTAITSAVGGGGNVIFPSPVAGLAKPRWYDWTSYDNDTTTYGSIPAKAYLGCLYRGRCVLSGNPNYPHQWYMSKIGDPWNWVYSSTDPLTAVAGNNADAGEIGDIIRALIPYKDDYLIFGCASTIWVLTGDPAAGGEIDDVDLTVGMFGANSWCFDGEGTLYFFGTGGVYKIPLGFRNVENLTEISLPDLIDDEDADPSTHRITMAYDRKRHGILICITKFSDGSNSNYWYDLKLQGFYPESYPDECGPYSLFYYAANDNDYADLLVGCKDGYIRKFDETAKDDNVGDSIDLILSYAVWPTQHLTEDNDKEGKLTSLTIELSGGLATVKLTHAALTTAHAKGDVLTQATSAATMVVAYSNAAKTLTFGYTAIGTFNTTNAVTGSGSGTGFTPTAVGTGTFSDTDGVSYEIHVGNDAETVIEKIKDGVAPHSSGTLSDAGRKARIRSKVRGAWMGIKFYNSTATETWAINRIFGDAKEVGKIKS